MDTECYEALRRAGAWFLHSGIQEPGGGVARYYRSDVGVNARLSTEITGYAASTLVYLHSTSGEPAYLDAALRAGRFLTRRAWDSRAATFPFELGLDGEPAEPLAYFFDAGIIVRGLLALWRATAEPEFLDVAVVCGESMAREFLYGGAAHPVLLLPSKKPAVPDSRWSRQPGCYQLKSALAWLELAECGGRFEHREHYERLLEYALETHAAFLTGEPERERVMDRLHAYCYFLEGLLPVAGRPECAQALEEGIRRAGRLLREVAPVFERSDVNAQLLRVRLLAAHLGAVSLEETCAAEEACRAAAFQLESEDRRIAGGFAFGRKGAQMMPHINPVSAAFCLQALRMWSEHRTGVWTTGWRAVI